MGKQPIPSRTITIALNPALRTTKINRMIRDTIDATIATQIKVRAPYDGLRYAFANRDYHPRSKGNPAKHVHGFGTNHRDTLVARYTPTLHEVIVHFPPNYTPERAEHDDWLATRVAIWDAMLHMLVKHGTPVALDDRPVRNPGPDFIEAVTVYQPRN